MEGDNISEVILYKECLRNHAASLGSYAIDGCGEFSLLDPNHTSPPTLLCAACGCHRNFHRKITSQEPSSPDTLMDYNNNNAGVPPASSSPEMIMSYKKRCRTKFSEEQKEKMQDFAEQLGWKLKRREEDDEVERFCKTVGLSRKVFKVWMHNHKNTLSTTFARNATTSSSTQE